jgi:hypothetical protein
MQQPKELQDTQGIEPTQPDDDAPHHVTPSPCHLVTPSPPQKELAYRSFICYCACVRKKAHREGNSRLGFPGRRTAPPLLALFPSVPRVLSDPFRQTLTKVITGFLPPFHRFLTPANPLAPSPIQIFHRFSPVFFLAPQVHFTDTPQTPLPAPPQLNPLRSKLNLWLNPWLNRILVGIKPS